ncbi:hypothetical protein KIPB_008766, partial [Kipferlia bialata]
ESQQIDRILLCFAHHYLSSEGHMFNHTHTVYAMSFALCMLNVDQHSPHIKRRMTVDVFTRNTKLVDNHNEMTDEILALLFDNMKKPFTLPEIESAKVDTAGNEEEARSLLTEQLCRQTEALRREARRRNRACKLDPSLVLQTDFLSLATGSVEILGAIIQTLTFPILASLALALEASSSEVINNLVLESLSMLSSLSGISSLRLSVERSAVVNALSKFTKLDHVWTRASVRTSRTPCLTLREIKAIKMIIAISSDTNVVISDAYGAILAIASNVSRILDEYETYKVTHDDRDMSELTKHNHALVHEYIRQRDVASIYTVCERLPQDAIVPFIRALTAVSEQ